jgi:hypothetical protein
MREVIGEHSEENFAAVVLEVLEQWDIISKVDSKLGWFQADNAPNNDTMIRKISHDLRQQYNLKYDYKIHRVRCQGHILNLSVHSFMFVTDLETG